MDNQNKPLKIPNNQASEEILYYLAPLNGFDINDLKGTLVNIHTQLGNIGKTFANLPKDIASPVNGNLFANVSATSLLLDKLTDHTKLNKASSTAISIDLLGCLSGEDALTVSILRPILHKVRDSYLRRPLEAKGNPLKASDLALFSHHLNTLKAGQLNMLVTQSIGKLDDWLKQASMVATGTLTILGLPPVATSASLKPLEPTIGTKNNNWYNPQKNYSSVWDAIETASSDEGIQFPPIPSPTIDTSTTDKIIALKATLSTEILAQSGVKEGQIGFYLQKLLEALDNAEEIEKTTAIVEGQPARIIVEKKEGVFEALAQVSPTCGSANDCKGGCDNTGGSIGFAMGEERLTQADFAMSGIVPLIWSRTYRSNLITYNKGNLGSRWTNEYLMRIDIRKNEWLFNTADGRIVFLPELEVGEAHRDPINGYIITRLDENTLSMSFGRDLLQLFQKQGDAHFKPVLFRDNQHHDIVMTYDNQYRLSQVRNPTNRHALQLNYDINNHIQTVDLINTQDEDNAQRIKTIAQYVYDKQGNLISATDENNDTRTFEYDNYHRLTRYTDRTGFGMNIEWVGRRHKGKAVHEYSDAGSRQASLNWKETLRQTTITNALGQSLTFFCDIDGYPVRNIFPDGREQWFFRDSGKNVVKRLDVDGRATSFDYNELDQLLAITANDSSKTFFEYNDKRQLVRITDANGHQWRKQYDDKGNLVKEFDPKDRVTQYQYNDQGFVAAITDPKGGINTFEYNAVGQITKQTDCSQKATEYSYNSEGQLTSTKDAEGHSTKYSYNSKGQLAKSTYPDGNSISYEYDAEGRLLSTQDNLGRVNKTQYDKAYYPIAGVDPLGRKVTTQRDIVGRVKILTDASGNRYQWQYDDLTGQVTQETSFNGKATQYTYNDQTGELVKKQEEGASPIYYQYDEMGRLIKRYTDNEQEDFIYDQMGQLIESQNSYSRMQYTYDSVGNLVKEIQEVNRLSETIEGAPTTKRYVWIYEYDVLGKQTTTIRPDGQRIDILNYGSGHIHSVLLNQQPLIDYDRDDIYRETGRQYANKIEQQNQFNKEGYLTAQTLIGNYSNKKSYQYNKQGLIRQIADQQNGSQNYEYDLVGRLIHASNKIDEERFYFDSANNLLDPKIITEQQNHEQTNKNYNLESRFPNSQGTVDYRIRADKNYRDMKNKGNLQKTFNDNQYEYDSRGNLIKKITPNETMTYEWNDFNQLLKLTNKKGTTHYRYDVEGRRIYKASISKTNGQNTLDETYYLWEGDTLAFEDHNGQLKHYLYEPDSFVPLAQFTTNEQNQPEQVYFYHNDHIGTPEKLTDEAGNVVWEQTSKTSFGQMKTRSYIHNLSNNIRFQGQYYDEESELHYNRFRYYDPEAGRYISEDPIKLAGGLNMYRYPQNPIHYVDPLGLWQGLIDWAQQPGLQHAASKAMYEAQNPSPKPPPKEGNAGVGLSGEVQLLGGGEVGVLFSQNYKGGRVTDYCAAIQVCASGGAEAGGSVNLIGEWTPNVPSETGVSVSTCGGGSAKVLLGGGGEMCVDTVAASQGKFVPTYGGKISAGAGGGVSASQCTRATICSSSIFRMFRQN